MPSLLLRTGLISLALLCCSCATLEAGQTGSHERDAPEFFVGTRLNLAALTGNRKQLDHFAEYSMAPADYPLLDLPLSFAADTFLFATEYGYCFQGSCATD